MAEFDNRTREIVQRLQAIRVKMLREQPFYAVLLMHLRFALDESTPTLYTDGERIAFNPYFVDELDDFQLQFVLMHEILHVALGHCTSEEKDFNHRVYNIACDIVVNSNIMYSLGLLKEKVGFGGKVIGYEVKKEVEIMPKDLVSEISTGCLKKLNRADLQIWRDFCLVLVFKGWVPKAPESSMNISANLLSDLKQLLKMNMNSIKLRESLYR